MIDFKKEDCQVSLAVYTFLMACGTACVSMKWSLWGYFCFLKRILSLS